MPTSMKSAGTSKPSPPKHDAPGRSAIAHEPEAMGRARIASIATSQIPRRESASAAKLGKGKSRGRSLERQSGEPAAPSVKTNLRDNGCNSGEGSHVDVRRDEPASSLEIRDWVRGPIASLAQTLYSQAMLQHQVLGRYGAAVRRLATDPRMQTVWREIFLRKGGAARTGSAYVYPARKEVVRGDPCFSSVEHLSKEVLDQDRLQEQAAALLFIETARFFVWDQRERFGPVVRTKRELDEENDILRELAARYEADAARLERVGDWQAGLPYMWVAQEAETPKEGTVFLPASVLLKALAAGARKYIRPTTSDDPWLVARKSNRVGNDWERGLIIWLEKTLDKLFGRRLLGTIARLANVALGRSDVTKGKVQGVLGRTR